MDGDLHAAIVFWNPLSEYAGHASSRVTRRRLQGTIFTSAQSCYVG